jgi:hypothetical protein
VHRVVLQLLGGDFQRGKVVSFLGYSEKVPAATGLARSYLEPIRNSLQKTGEGDRVYSAEQQVYAEPKNFIAAALNKGAIVFAKQQNATMQAFDGQKPKRTSNHASNTGTPTMNPQPTLQAAVSKTVELYNRMKSPAAFAKTILVTPDTVIISFTGTFCVNCEVPVNYVEDFVKDFVIFSDKFSLKTMNTKLTSKDSVEVTYLVMPKTKA